MTFMSKPKYQSFSKVLLDLKTKFLTFSNMVNLIIFLQNNFICFAQQAVPKSDEWESKEKTKSSSKVCNQRGDRVNQLLSLDGRLLGDCPQGKSKLFWFQTCSFFLPNKVVFPVLARLEAARQRCDLLQICCSQFLKYFCTIPARRYFGSESFKVIKFVVLII